MNCQCKHITVYGRVQGVGFRPSACVLGESYGLTGFVRNAGGQVEIFVKASLTAYESFLTALKELPAPVCIDEIDEQELPPEVFENIYLQYAINHKTSFFSVESIPKLKLTLPTPDLAICPDCLREMQDPANPRYNYPYISCAHCGPRYTLTQKLPYDRINTSLASYSLCPTCKKEYLDINNRRSHGETISCNNCGPQLYGLTKTSSIVFHKHSALQEAKQLLQAGEIILIKAVGGYNLVARGDLPETIRTLRRLKQRPTKPFAILCHNLTQAKKYCRINKAEENILLSPARPIVLLVKHQGNNFSLPQELSPTCYEQGILLPPMGLYSQISQMDYPLIVTSCNVPGNPIITQDQEAKLFYLDHEEIAGFFAYRRDILWSADDSVVRIINADNGLAPSLQILRRSRGYMPEALKNPTSAFNNEVAAVGAQLEPSFCLSKNNQLYMAQVPGNFAEEATEKRWLNTQLEWQAFLEHQPKKIVSDLHPEYTTTIVAKKLAETNKLSFLQVQHHHAHALSVIAEHQLKGASLAFCFDGTGYGTDGTVWGGEMLLCSGSQFRRVAQLEPLQMLGGDISMKQAWKTALCYLNSLKEQLTSHEFTSTAKLLLKEQEKSTFILIQQALKNNVNLIQNSSMGRLFDAVAAILGLASYNSHQGCCAQTLEAAAYRAIIKKLSPIDLNFHFHFNNEKNYWSPAQLLQKIIRLKTSSANTPELLEALALGFHYAIVNMIVSTAQAQKQQTSFDQIVLCGGCFANRILLEEAEKCLKAKGFKVYHNEKIPPGDGGIALGQAYYGIIIQDDTNYNNEV